MQSSYSNNSPEGQIASLINDKGMIPFDVFMDMALYGDSGYYRNSLNPFGINGDYFTSPRVHPVFAFCLAKQLFNMWKILDSPVPFLIYEDGAGDDLLATDILRSFQIIDSKMFDATNYYIHDMNLINSINPKIQNATNDLNIFHVVISNELFDAMPVKLFEVHNNTVQEVFLSLRNSRELQETLNFPSPELADFLRPLNVTSLEGYRGPVNLHVEDWVSKISEKMNSGFMITIDYGYLEDIYFSMEKSHKLIQTYYQHSDGGNLLQRIGRQDITAHVNFSHLMSVGEQNQFKPVFFDTQKNWLQMLGFDQIKNIDIFNNNRRIQNLISSLVDQTGLGNFKVLIQAKNIDELDFQIFNNEINSFDYSEDIEITKRHIAYKLI